MTIKLVTNKYIHTWHCLTQDVLYVVRVTAPSDVERTTRVFFIQSNSQASPEQAEQRVCVGHRLDVGVRHSLVRHKFRFEVTTASQVDEGTLVAHGVAVIGGREHRDALAVMSNLKNHKDFTIRRKLIAPLNSSRPYLVSCIFNFVRPDDVIEVVVAEKGCCHVGSELASYAPLAWRTAPTR